MKEGGYIWIGIGAVIGAVIGFFAVQSYKFEFITKDTEVAGWAVAVFLILWGLVYAKGSYEEGAEKVEGMGCTSAVIAIILTGVIFVFINHAAGIVVGALIGAVISAIIYYVFKATQDS